MKTDQWTVQSWVFGAILVVLLLLVFRLFAPFFTPLLWSTLLYIMFSPLHRRVIRKLDFTAMKGKILRNMWAGIFTLGTILLIIFPLSMVLRIFLRQILELGHVVQKFLNDRPEYLSEMYDKIAALIKSVSGDQINLSAADIENQIKLFLADKMQIIVSQSTAVLKGVGSFAVTLLFMTFSIFFFYVDGPYLSRLVLSAIPIKKEYISTLTGKFMEITRNLFFGYIIVALLQSVVAGIIYTIFGVKGALVLSVLTFILVFIPMFGATIIYIPVSVYMIAGGNVAGGILFFIVSVVFISGIDNVLRPFFLRDRIQLHPLIIFFAIMGGLFVFGFNGFILGPVLVILFLTVLDLFLTEHKIGGNDSVSGKKV